jgi:hypothetical protein
MEQLGGYSGLELSCFRSKRRFKSLASAECRCSFPNCHLLFASLCGPYVPALNLKLSNIKRRSFCIAKLRHIRAATYITATRCTEYSATSYEPYLYLHPLTLPLEKSAGHLLSYVGSGSMPDTEVLVYLRLHSEVAFAGFSPAFLAQRVVSY